MIRNWLTLGWTPLLAAAMVANPLPVVIQAAHADPPGSSAKKNNDSPAPKPAADKEALDKLTKAVERLTTRISKLESDLGRMKADRDTDIGQINDFIKHVNSDMPRLIRDVGQLRKEVDDLKRQKPATSTSAYGSPAAAGTARVRMVNRYAVPMKVLVTNRSDRKSYLLQPGETRDTLPMPAGAFTFEVYQDPGDGNVIRVTDGPQRRALAADSIYRLTIEPKGT